MFTVPPLETEPGEEMLFWERRRPRLSSLIRRFPFWAYLLATLGCVGVLVLVRLGPAGGSQAPKDLAFQGCCTLLILVQLALAFVLWRLLAATELTITSRRVRLARPGRIQTAPIEDLTAITVWGRRVLLRFRSWPDTKTAGVLGGIHFPSTPSSVLALCDTEDPSGLVETLRGAGLIAPNIVVPQNPDELGGGSCALIVFGGLIALTGPVFMITYCIGLPLLAGGVLQMAQLRRVQWGHKEVAWAPCTPTQFLAAAERLPRAQPAPTEPEPPPLPEPPLPTQDGDNAAP